MKSLKQIYVRYQLLVRPVVTIVASIAVIVLVIIPQLLTFFSVKEKIERSSSRTGVLQTKAAQLEDINEGDYAKRLKVVFAALPKERDVPTTLLSLQILLSQSGLIWDSAKVLDSSQTGTFQIGLSVIGTRAAIRSFVIALAQAPRIFKLESIDIQGIKNNSTSQAEIALTVFYDPKVEAPINVEQPIPTLSEEEQGLLTRLTNAQDLIQLPAADTQTVAFGKSDPLQ